MQNSNDKNNTLSAELELLRTQNAALQKQVADLQSEKNGYLRTIHAMAKEKMNISEEVVQAWMAEERVDGGSLVEFINEVKAEK